MLGISALEPPLHVAGVKGATPVPRASSTASGVAVVEDDGHSSEPVSSPLPSHRQPSSSSSSSMHGPVKDHNGRWGYEKEIDARHTKCAEALIKVIEMKNLNFFDVLEKLETYAHRFRPNPVTVVERSHSDGHFSDDASITSMTSEVSTFSSHCRRATKNSERLARHIAETPVHDLSATSSRIQHSLPLKDDPEFVLYFRMLKYGFTLGAVRAALQRDGKVDITRLNPDRPLLRQRIPSCRVWEEEEESPPKKEWGQTFKRGRKDFS